MTAAAPLRRTHQHGVLLLEAMVALVIFAIGVLGLVAAQSATLKETSNARYRSMAAALANDLVSHMWMSDRTTATLQASFGSKQAGTGYVAWRDRVYASGMPGTSDHQPEVTFSTVSGTSSTSSQATIKVHWQVPGDTTVHTFTTLAQLQ